ncbi:hypothetical protein BDZ45DRAFT_721690 [Acephala macrosclerotiorum]|nr:hypothetical protein BDZ45DRAFT_721690 [Acephala macrosclerotiorum]
MLKKNRAGLGGMIVLSIIFPPLAVLITAGCSIDFVINCAFLFFFIIGSVPHAIYVQVIYWTRKDKVARGIPIIRRQNFIFSEKLQRGGRHAPAIVEPTGGVFGEGDLESGVGNQAAGETGTAEAAGKGDASVCSVGGETLDEQRGEHEEHRASVHSREAAVEDEEHTS